MKTQPSAAAVSGTALDQQPAVQLVDGTGANEALSGVVVTASLTGGTGTLGGTLTRTTDGTGAATFTDLVITADPGDYTLKFTAPGYGQRTSSAIALTAAPSTIAITTNPPTSALTGEVFDPDVQPEVQVKDGTGQPAAGVVVTATHRVGRRHARGNDHRDDRRVGLRQVRRPRHQRHRRPADPRVRHRGGHGDRGADRRFRRCRPKPRRASGARW